MKSSATPLDIFVEVKREQARIKYEVLKRHGKERYSWRRLKAEALKEFQERYPGQSQIEQDGATIALRPRAVTASAVKTMEFQVEELQVIEHS